MKISIKAELARAKIKQKDLAKAIGIHPVTLSKKLNTDSFSLKEAEDAFEFMGLELLIVQKNLPLIG